MGRILFWCAGVVLVVVVAAVIATPWIVRAGVPEAFARLGLQASVTGGKLNLLRREISLEGFILGKPEAPALSFGELGVGVEVRALLGGRIKLDHLRVKEVSVNVERLLALQKRLDTGLASPQASLPVELNRLEFEDVELTSLGERIGHDVRITRLELGDLSALAAERKSSVDLEGTIGEGRVKVELELGLEQGKLRAKGKYRIDALPLRGWARLGSQDSDPLSSGVVHARGELNLNFAIDSRSLDVVLDGRMNIADFGMDTARLKSEHGDATWQGRLALEWSPQLARPELRGDGSLDVEALGVIIVRPSQAPMRAKLSDVSWHGDFDWRDAFTIEGAVLGTRADVTDASQSTLAWRGHAEDFSWRLHSRIEGDSDHFVVRIQDFDLARLSVSVMDGDASVEIAAEKLAVDELRSARSGVLVVGLASADALTIDQSGGKGDSERASYDIRRLKAKGLSGNVAGRFHTAQMSAESLDYARSGGRLRAEGIELASVGFSTPGWVGAEELNVKTVRADEGRGDIWLSGLRAKRVRGDSGGSFGAEAVDVTHVFQSGTDERSWEASSLKLRGIDGDIHDAARISAINLGELKLGIGDTSWESSDLHTAELVLGMNGDVSVARLGLAKLERRQPSIGDLQIFKLDGRGLRSQDGHALLDAVTVATLEYRLPNGFAFATKALEARALSGDASKGLEVEHVSVASATGHDVDDTRLGASALETREVSIASNGNIAIAKLHLGSFSRTAPDSSTLGLDGLDVASLSWAPGNHLSTAKASLAGAGFVLADGTRWTLSELDTGNLAWDGAVRISADRASLASVSQSREKSRDWRVQSLQATDFQLDLPAEVALGALTAESVDGGSGGAPAWTLASLEVEGFSSSESDGQKADVLRSGALTVSDDRNGAALSVEHTAIEAASVSVLNELSARQLLVGGLRLGSDKPDWPARLSMAELRIKNPLLHFGGILELGEVVAKNPYLVVAQSKDNVWMLPPLPGGKTDGADSQSEGNTASRSSGGIRVGRFTTRGPGRVVYVDRATNPAVQLALDPVVLAMVNLDTSLPGNRSRFRARGSTAHLADMTLYGELTKRVQGFDLALKVDMLGAHLPELNPYIARHEPIAITTGRGDVRSTLAIENERLSGEVDLLLSGLQVKTMVDGTPTSSSDPTNFPLRTGLALLKDRQGNISLSIPLQAQTEDPNYDFVDTFQKDFVGTVKTARKVAANLSGKTLDRALQLVERTISILPGVDTEDYSPIEFAPGADAFAARSFIYLEQLGQRMLEHEALVISLCGRSVSRDSEARAATASGIDKLFAEANDGVYGAYGPGHEGLLALATARSNSVRRYLRDLRGVPDRQLARCDAEIDPAPDAKPRVELPVKSPADRKGLFGIFF